MGTFLVIEGLQLEEACLILPQVIVYYGFCLWQQAQRKGGRMQLAWRVGIMTQQDPGQQGRVEEVGDSTCQVQR